MLQVQNLHRPTEFGAWRLRKRRLIWLVLGLGSAAARKPRVHRSTGMWDSYHLILNHPMCLQHLYPFDDPSTRSPKRLCLSMCFLPSPFSVEILKAARERIVGSLYGVAFLLCSNFVSYHAATYAVADSIAKSDDEMVPAKLKAFLLERWLEAAFLDGLRQGQEHYMNIVRISRMGESLLCLMNRPPPLRVGIAYLPFYRRFVASGGSLLPQGLRGQLLEVARRLGIKGLEKPNRCSELLAILGYQYPLFCHH